jgi:menaquinone-specific isochorismate synthase
MLVNNALQTEIAQTLNQQGPAMSVQTFELPSIHLLNLATVLDIDPMVYLSSPSQTNQYLAIGAWQSFNQSEAETFLATAPNTIQLFGGQAFHPDHAHHLPEAYWILPKCWLHTTPTRTQLVVVCDTLTQTPDTCNQQLQTLFTHINHAAITKPAAMDYFYTDMQHKPNQRDWEMAVQTQVNNIKQGQLQKVVLARQSTCTFNQAVNPFAMLATLQAHDPNVHHFCIQFHTHKAFIGGTPERLFQIDNHTLYTEAIAGTLLKQNDINIDQLKTTLIENKKLHSEHAYVVDWLQTQLQTLCTSTDASQPSVIELTHLMHRIQSFTGTLAPDTSAWDCLRQLHPTPAVAGTPTHQAVATIKQTDPFLRDWYAGPVGYISNKHSRILVAIRSAIVDLTQPTVTLFSGAGIVSDSDPQTEWAEINGKISGFTTLFKRTPVYG